MIEVKCECPNHLMLGAMQLFQGELKKRNDSEITALSVSIKESGLLMPFAIWQYEGNNYILDGHARYQALIKLALSDPSVLTQQLPVINIEALNENEARKALLEIVSTCGRINKQGVLQFAAPVTASRAPILVKAQRIKKAHVTDSITIRLSVAKDKVDKLRSLLSEVDGVEIL